MEMSVIVATLRHCPASALDDPHCLEGLLRGAIAAGGFTLLHLHTHHFTPQGVSAAVLLAESHIALHSWPEEGALFVDLATCSGEAAAERAFQWICDHLPHAEVQRHVWHKGAAA